MFDEAAASLLRMAWRPEVTIEEIPAPQRIAPHAVAVAADVDVAGDEVGNGRLVLLHDSQGNPAWEGTFRCVTFARASVDPEMTADPLLAEVGWSWLEDALARRGAEYVAPGGTVTAVTSRSFGSMEDEPERAEVEIRASWTPVLESGSAFLSHVEAWQDLLCMVSGLPLLPDGVTPISSHRRPAGRSGR